MNRPKSLNVLIKNEFSRKKDADFFKDKKYLVVSEKTDMLDLLVRARIFPSKTSARKNGWANKRQIQDGFNVFTVGKYKVSIVTFKPNASNLNWFALQIYKGKQWMIQAKSSFRNWIMQLRGQFQTLLTNIKKSLKTIWQTHIGH